MHQCRFYILYKYKEVKGFPFYSVGTFNMLTSAKILTNTVSHASNLFFLSIEEATQQTLNINPEN